MEYHSSDKPEKAKLPIRKINQYFNAEEEGWYTEDPDTQHTLTDGSQIALKMRQQAKRARERPWRIFKERIEELLDKAILLGNNQHRLPQNIKIVPTKHMDGQPTQPVLANNTNNNAKSPLYYPSGNQQLFQESTLNWITTHRTSPDQSHDLHQQSQCLNKTCKVNRMAGGQSTTIYNNSNRTVVPNEKTIPEQPEYSRPVQQRVDISNLKQAQLVRQQNMQRIIQNNYQKHTTPYINSRNLNFYVDENLTNLPGTSNPEINSARTQQQLQRIQRNLNKMTDSQAIERANQQIYNSPYLNENFEKRSNY